MQYQNPIIRGFNPDPSICRVGEDYYLVTSTFEFFPGIPVYHSRDLVNWTQTGNCIHRPSQLPMDKEDHNEGIWAPVIRYHNGRFYVTSKAKAFGNFIVSAEDPAGPWSDPVHVNINGIDPDLLFDGDKCYITTNDRCGGDRESLSMAEVNPDTGELLSPIRPIWHGMTHWKPKYLEAPHVYHIGDWYYVWGAEGGTGYEHTITCGRSKDIWGPYENCPWPLLTNVPVGDSGVACAGHGDLLQAADGSWWCVHLATRPDDAWYSHLGRETFLLPVTWKDEWPVIADGRSHLTWEAPLWAAQQPLQPWEADLSRIEDRWLFLRRPDIANYRCSAEGITLAPGTARLKDETGSPTMMLVRPVDICCRIEAEIDFTPAQEGDDAGVVMYISRYGYYIVGVKQIDGRRMITVTRSGGGPVPLPVEAPQSRITFRIDAGKECCIFRYAGKDGIFHDAVIRPVFGRTEAGKCFTGTLFGVYAQCEQETTAAARLLRFTMNP